MRYVSVVLVWLTLLATTSLRGAEFFVGPDGRDDAAGTREAPFATIQRAQREVAPGDTVWIRGGVYRMREDQIAARRGPYSCVTLLDKSGTREASITYAAHPGEQPVFDFAAVKPAGRRVTAFRVEGSWIRLVGLEVTGVQVTIRTHTQSIAFDNQGSHNVYERLSIHDGMAIGVWIGNGSNNLVLNCDAYRNWDNVSGDQRGGNVDGFGYHGPKGSVNNVFRGCRAWFNSDDGFDFINSHEPATIENCWAFYNGYAPDFTPLADGNGFKAGGHAGTPVERLPKPLPRHVVRGSVAVGNKANGVYANHHTGGLDWSHNTAYRNAVNFNLRGRDPADNTTVIPGRGHWLRNNLSFGARHAEVAEMDVAACDSKRNSWDDRSLMIEGTDFLSLDESELIRPRQPNGDLPTIRFLQLSPGSRAIDRGADLGRPFRGYAPDLGAFETEP